MTARYRRLNLAAESNGDNVDAPEAANERLGSVDSVDYGRLVFA